MVIASTAALVCVAASLPALALALRGLRRAPRPWRQALFGLTFLGFVLRAFTPERWVMFYTGYELLDAAVLLEENSPLLAKYGEATFIVHNLARQFARPLGFSDFDTWVWVNRLHGAAIIPLAAALTRATGGTWRAAAITAGAIATTPLLIRDAATESQLVMVTAWLVGGATLWARALGGWALGARALGARTLGSNTLAMKTSASIPPAVGAVALFGAALNGRPEALVLVPVLLLVLAWLVRASARQARAPIAVTVLLLLVCAGLRGWQLKAGLATQAGLGNTPKLFEVGPITLAITALTDGVFRKSLLLLPEWTPALLPIFAASGLWARRAHGRTDARRATAAWLLFAFLIQSVATLDLPWLSLSRVQAPALVWAAIACGIGADRHLTQATKRLATWLGQGTSDEVHHRRALRGLSVAGLMLWSLSITLTMPALSRTTVADTEHELIRFAYDHLQPGETLAYRSWDDAPDERLHLHFPRQARPRHTQITHLDGVEAARRLDPRRRTLVLLGTRCHMRRCDAPSEHPACVRIRKRYKLIPLMEREVRPQSGPLPWPFEPAALAEAPGLIPELDFPWCVRAGALRVGVYAINGNAPLKRDH